MPVTVIDMFDDAALRPWYEAMTDGARADRVDPPLWNFTELSATYRDPDRSTEHILLAAMEDGAIVGTATIEYPLRDNLDLVEIDVLVPPAHRGRGIGSELYDAAAGHIAELGRTTVGAAINQPVEATRVPGAAFLDKRGFTRRNIEARRVLRLPIASDVITRIEKDARARSSEYRVVTWRDHCPDDYAEQYAHLKALLSVQAPLGELDYEMENWDVARLRADEQLAVKQRRITLTAVAVAPDGSLAGHTQIAVPQLDPGRAYQWDTLVLPSHRGHRLGALLKAVNIRRMAEFPDKNRIETWNALQNDHMNAINNDLGFETVEHFEEWQRTGV